IGDVSSILPVLLFNTGGYEGTYHGIDLHVSDEEAAYILPAKIFALTAYNLLKNNASEAKKLINNFKPLFTKEEYISYKHSLFSKLRIEPTGII
ncbi:MAG: amidohydrolase, partial [Ruminococcaceae bacterium]|nr:amidohydrolase [Oscillospiraceae bacterium]